MRKLKSIPFIIILLFNSLLSFSIIGQESKQVAYTNNDAVFTKAEQMPEFKGGEKKLFEFISTNIKYPDVAWKNGVTGKVYVNFVVDKSGKVRDAKILRGIGAGCDEEVLRVFSIMPDWAPGKNDGKPVNVSFNLPVVFDLKDGDKKKEK